MHPLPLATKNADVEAVDSDLDTPYKYIVVTPPLQPTQTQQEFWSTTHGVNEDNELDIVMSGNCFSPLCTVEDDGGERSRALAVLQERFHWPTAVAAAVVPGYSSDFNGTDLFALYDSSNSNSSNISQTDLPPNVAAGYALMRPEAACQGVVVFAARTRDMGIGDTIGRQHSDSASCGSGCESGNGTRSAVVTLSRRDVLLLAEYNHSCGGQGMVSSRLHFENIRRAESLHGLRAQEFTVI